MTVANVRYITNGYIVGANVPTAPALQSVYAATIPEVVYWIGRIFDPIVAAAPLPGGTPTIIVPPDDPLLGQRASVEEIASGGFLVTQVPSPVSGGQFVELYCVSMDAVSDALTQIFTPPVAP